MGGSGKKPIQAYLDIDDIIYGEEMVYQKRNNGEEKQNRLVRKSTGEVNKILLKIAMQLRQTTKSPIRKELISDGVFP